MEWGRLAGDSSLYQQAPITGSSTGKNRISLGNIHHRVKKNKTKQTAPILYDTGGYWLPRLVRVGSSLIGGSISFYIRFNVTLEKQILTLGRCCLCCGLGRPMISMFVSCQTHRYGNNIWQERPTPKSKIGIFKRIQGLIALSWLYLPWQDDIAEKVHILCQLLDLEYPSPDVRKKFLHVVDYALMSLRWTQVISAKLQFSLVEEP